MADRYLLLLAHLKAGDSRDLPPLSACFDAHEAIAGGFVPPHGKRLLLHVRRPEELHAVIVKSDTTAFTLRWGTSGSFEERPGTGRLAPLDDMLQEMAAKIESVPISSPFLQAASAALRRLPLPALITLDDPLGHCYLLRNDSPPTSWTIDADEEYYPRSFEQACDLGLLAPLHTPPVEIEDKGEALLLLQGLLGPAKRIVAFTGAGVSVESGIPSYRGCSDALWEKFSEEDVGYQNFLASPDVRARFWKIKTYFWDLVLAAQPNHAHFFLARLHAAGRLHRVITQNIDGLHQRAGLPDSAVLALHGSEEKVKCEKCERTTDRAPVHALLKAGVTLAPLCEARESGSAAACGGLLRPTTIMFGEPLAAGVLDEAAETMREADLVLIIGTSLVVQPANKLPGIALMQGAPLVLINLSSGVTPYDSFAQAVIRLPAADLLRDVVLSP